MISKDFKIDFKKKKIYHNPHGSDKIYSLNTFYSYLQNVFDEPEFMEYEIPIEALSKTKYLLINNWKVDKKSRQFLKGGSLT